MKVHLFFYLNQLSFFLVVGSENTCFGMYNGLIHDFNKGDSWSNKGKCILHRCKGENQVMVERCPQVTLQEGCKLSKEDTTKYFPGCCPYPICSQTVTVMCEDADDGTLHKPGEEWQPPGQCVHKECVGGGLTVVSSCTIHELQPGCSYSETDLTQPFPKCCPKMICTNHKKEDDK